MISEGDRYVGGGPSRLRLHVSAGRKGQLPSPSDKQCHPSFDVVVLAVQMTRVVERK